MLVFDRILHDLELNIYERQVCKGHYCENVLPLRLPDLIGRHENEARFQLFLAVFPYQ